MYDFHAYSLPVSQHLLLGLQVPTPRAMVSRSLCCVAALCSIVALQQVSSHPHEHVG